MRGLCENFLKKRIEKMMISYLSALHIDKARMLEIAKPLSKNGYGEYLKDLVK